MLFVFRSFFCNWNVDIAAEISAFWYGHAPVDGNFTNKYLYRVSGYLFFDPIFAADDRGPAKFKKQLDHVLYGKKQQADRKTCKSADRNEIILSNDNGFIDYFILHTVTEWKNELNIASFLK